MENKKYVGVKKEIKGDREQFQKLFHTFCQLLEFFEQSKFFPVIRMCSMFPYFSINLDFVYLCPLITFVYLCSTDASMHKFCAC